MTKAIKHPMRPVESRRQGPSDEELMLRYRDHGDPEAIDTLVHRFERELFSYLVRYLGDAHLAEEVFQKTFLRLHQKRELYTEGRRVRPWLYGIATHQAIDLLRRRGRRSAVSLDTRHASTDGEGGTLMELLESDAPTPLAEASDEERRRWTRAAVEDLPETLRLAVILVYFQGLKYREVAEALDVPLGTVKSRLHKALFKLNQAWRREHREDEEEE